MVLDVKFSEVIQFRIDPAHMTRDKDILSVSDKSTAVYVHCVIVDVRSEQAKCTRRAYNNRSI